jgi:predicted nuclease of predicted toxin-antitoxin system
MLTILLDHNIKGFAPILAGAIRSEGWLELQPIQIVTFAEVGLSDDLDDRTIWRFAQAEGMILLTDNRNRSGVNSLEQATRDEGTPSSLPVLTIGNTSRLRERAYRVRCVERIIEIIFDLDNLRGTPRLFIP